MFSGVMMRLTKERMAMVYQLQSTVRIRNDKRLHPYQPTGPAHCGRL